MKLTAFALMLLALLTGNSNVNAQTATPTNLTNVNGVLFYTTITTAEGTELWKTDGTAAGTVLVKDINPGSTDSNPSNLKAVGSILYFSANDGTNGHELWKSDGTAAGTVMVKDINPAGNSNPKSITVLNGNIYFSAATAAEGAELWKSDGTAAGTVLVKDIQTGATGGLYMDQNFVLMGSHLYFKAYTSADGLALWKTDGTTAGTVSVSVPAGDFTYLTALGSQLIFTTYSATSGREIWKSDGTTAGTALLKDINTAGDSWPREYAVLGSTLFFTADHNSFGTELWKTDGTDAGTVMVTDLFSGGSSHPEHTVAMNGMVYFATYGNNGDIELWKSDGTAAGTTLVKNINPAGASYPLYLTVAGNTLYFRATDGTNGYELWKSDGTTSGTVLVKNINPGANSADLQYLTAVGNILYFSANDGTNGKQLWKTDGTTAGTVMVKDAVAISITTGTVAAAYCQGAGFNLPYTINGTYNAGNVFTAQLSNASGSFAAPVTIGSVTATTAGNIAVTIPAGTAAGTGYRIRVVSSNPAVTGSDNGVDITVNAIPTAAITAPSTSFCASGSLLLTSSGGGSYQWKKDGTDIGGATSQTYSATTAGSYTVTVTTSGCSGTSAAYVVSVNPVTSINTQPANVTVCQLNAANFSVAATGTGALGYQWRKNGVAIVGANNASYAITSTVPADAGNYDVVVTGSCGTVTSSAAVLTVNTCTAVPNINSNVEEASLLPTLVRSKSTLRITVRSSMKVDFIISDANGNHVLTVTKQLNAGRNDISLDLSKLAAGSYYINGSNAKGKIGTIRFVKQ